MQRSTVTGEAMSMTFDSFFNTATGSSKAYPYQRRFAMSETLPTLLSVPTGTGKTATVVLGWLWRRRFADRATMAGTPRRLVYCLPMRTLVEQTRNECLRWLDRSNLFAGEVRYFADDKSQPIESYSTDIESDWQGEKVGVHVLMGGEDPDDWDIHPQRDAIIIGTQDMLLSRALNRGYGMTRYRWPMHFGLLNNDCLWILDETQLMGAGLFTSAQLDLFGRIWPREKLCHFLWMSATIRSTFLDTADRREKKLQVGAPTVLQPDDLIDSRLCTRLNAEKQVEVLRSAPSAKRILDEHQDGRITLVILNTVPAARSMHEALMGQIRKDARLRKSPPQVCLLHGRYRHSDRQRQISKIVEFVSRSTPDTGAVPGSPGLIVVSTQVIEAGFDLSSVRLWSELAPWASMVQRLGRLNRAGKQPEARAFVWLPKAELDYENHKDSPNAKRIGPYEKQAVTLAKKLIQTLIERQSSSASFRDSLDSVCKLPEAQEALDVEVDSVIRPNDFFELFATEPDLASGFTEISHFVRSGDRNADVQVFWRVLSASPTEDEGQPDRDELCSVPVYEVQRFVGNRLVAFEWNTDTRVWESRRLKEIRPGMTLLLAQSAGGYSDTVGWTGNRRDRPTIGVKVLDEPESFEADPNSLGADWVELSDHVADVRAKASELVDALDLDKNRAASVRMAAQWHDWGKSLERWQSAALGTTTEVKENINKMLCSSEQSRFHELIRDWLPRFDAPQNGESLWAKFPDVRELIQHTSLSREEKRELTLRLRAPFRPEHRHEAASALAAWVHWRSGNSDLTALAVYLIACHHGKVRTVMRRTRENPNVFGLMESDEIRPVPNVSDRGHSLNFDCCRFGASGSWTDDARAFELSSPSWLQMIDELLGPGATKREEAVEVIPEMEPRAVGPLVLAYLECIICAADIRASKQLAKGTERP